MRFQILGPLRVHTGQGWVSVAAEQQRVVLAVLLVEAGRSVSADALADAVWGDRPPRTAKNTIAVYVRRLRRLVGEALITRDRGYELRVHDDAVDAMRFERRLTSGRRELAGGRRETGAALLAEALALWPDREPVLADVPRNPLIQPRVTHLEQLRLSVVEDHIDALLALGRHTDVVDELHRLVQEQPMRERLWTLLMTALQRCGRRAEALDVYQRVRRVLHTELGLEPSPRLRLLQQAILTEGQEKAGASERETPRVVPAQLPPDVAAFTGRGGDLRRLDALLPADADPRAGAVVISAIAGTAGIGKTALAVHWAHTVRDRFPDGQLYVNLRGYADGPPMPPIEALARFLRALGVPPAQVPSDQDEAGALYRSLLAGQNTLVLLDNARHPDQVRPLLPGGTGCLVLVTSRDRLDGLLALDGAVPLALDVLTPEESYGLLGRFLGDDRLRAEPQAAAELATLCNHLPLALRIAAANLAVRPKTGIGVYVTRLRQDRLGRLRSGDVAVRAAFGLSYAVLPGAARRLFRLLGLTSVADVTPATAAALAGTGPATAEWALERLAAAHLVQEHTPGRYGMHDLIRSCAAETAVAEEPEAGRRAAAGRLYDHYLRHVGSAASLLFPHLARLDAHIEASATLTDPDQASAWLDAERANVISLVRDGVAHGLARQACVLADGLRGDLHRRMRLVDWATLAQATLAAAEAGGGPQAMAAARLGLATLNAARGDYAQAIEEGESALGLAGQVHWTDGESAALNVLGTAYAEQGQLDRAAERYTQALTLDRVARRAAGQAIRLGNLGNLELMRGRLEAAIGHYAEALMLHRQTGSAAGEALTLDQLGLAHQGLGHLETALGFLTEARDRFAALGERGRLAATTRAIAGVHRDAGRHHDALRLAQAALTTAREIGDRKVQADTLLTRAGIRSALGDLGLAIGDYRQAADIARSIGHGYIHTETLIGLADVHHRCGDLPAADDAARAALALARKAGYRLLEGRARTAIAAIQLASGDHEAALDSARQALSIQDETGLPRGRTQADIVAAQARARIGDPRAGGPHAADDSGS